MKKIVIKSCNSCTYRDHRGAFGAVGYIPYCTLKSKNLPYTEYANNSRIVAQCTGEIPDWCPLEDDDS